MKYALTMALLLTSGVAHAQLELDAPFERAVQLPSVPPAHGVVPDGPSPPAQAFTPDAPPTSTQEVVPVLPSPSDALPYPAGYALSRWEKVAGGPDGIRDPVLMTHADRGLILAGALIFSVAYAIAAPTSTLLALTSGCSWWTRCDPSLGMLGLLPLAHGTAGLSNTGASAGAAVVGVVLGAIELVGLILLVAGAAHNHPQLVPREAHAGAPEPSAARFEW